MFSVYLESGSCIGQQYDEATSCSQWALDRLMSLEGTKLTPNETMIEWCGYVRHFVHSTKSVKSVRVMNTAVNCKTGVYCGTHFVFIFAPKHTCS